MNKQDLIELVSERTNQTKKDVKTVIDAFFTLISDSLYNGSKVTISNFGVFETKKVDTYYRFHPQTGEKIQIKFPNRIYFRPSLNLKKYINGEYIE